VVDDDRFHGGFARLEFETELLDGGEDELLGVGSANCWLYRLK
jgi:hypothetical protein